jgi:hypothetical protein
MSKYMHHQLLSGGMRKFSRCTEKTYRWAYRFGLKPDIADLDWSIDGRGSDS